MLEEVLNKINTNLERIANVIEKKEVVERHRVATVATKSDENIENQMAVEISTESSFSPTASPTESIPTADVQAAVVNVPVAKASESFTYEQIARAMATAMDGGRQDVIQNILTSFNVKSLMEIAPENYNKVATILRGAGISL